MSKVIPTAFAAFLGFTGASSADVFCAPRDQGGSVLVISQKRDPDGSPGFRAPLGAGSRFMKQGSDDISSDRLLRGTIVQADGVLNDVWIDADEWSCVFVDFLFQSPERELEARLKS